MHREREKDRLNAAMATFTFIKLHNLVNFTLCVCARAIKTDNMAHAQSAYSTGNERNFHICVACYQYICGNADGAHTHSEAKPCIELYICFILCSYVAE